MAEIPLYSLQVHVAVVTSIVTFVATAVVTVALVVIMFCRAR